MASSCLEMKIPSPQSSRREEGNWTDSGEQVRVERKPKAVQGGVADMCVRKHGVPLRIERRCRMLANTQGILFVELHI